MTTIEWIMILGVPALFGTAAAVVYLVVARESAAFDKKARVQPGE
jgi:hypothetical protein